VGIHVREYDFKDAQCSMVSLDKFDEKIYHSITGCMLDLSILHTHECSHITATMLFVSDFSLFRNV